MFEKKCEKLAEMLKELSQGVNDKSLCSADISYRINDIRDILLDIKKISIR